MLHGQAYASCPLFLTVALRGSSCSFSTPMWLIILSNQLTLINLVGFYPHQLFKRAYAHLKVINLFSYKNLFILLKKIQTQK